MAKLLSGGLKSDLYVTMCDTLRRFYLQAILVDESEENRQILIDSADKVSSKNQLAMDFLRSHH